MWMEHNDLWNELFSACFLFSVQRVEGWLDHAHPSVFSPVATKRGGTRLNGDQWATSTPDRQESDPVSFDGGRVRAWLGVQNSAPPERRTSCSKAVQTDGEVEVGEVTFVHTVGAFVSFYFLVYLEWAVYCMLVKIK